MSIAEETISENRKTAYFAKRVQLNCPHCKKLFHIQKKDYDRRTKIRPVLCCSASCRALWNNGIARKESSHA